MNERPLRGGYGDLTGVARPTFRCYACGRRRHGARFLLHGGGALCQSCVTEYEDARLGRPALDPRAFAEQKRTHSRPPAPSDRTPLARSSAGRFTASPERLPRPRRGRR
jgi:recombinational DNA repair protein (RecF pathway)